MLAKTTALPSPSPLKKVAFRVPNESEVADTVVLASARRGRALLNHTRDSLPSHVGNALVCTNCHQQLGTLRNGMGWVGVYARFPQYRSRAGATQLIEDRVNDCFKRSLNGTPLVPESRDMRDIVAYMAFLSTGYPVGAETDGQGLPKMEPLPVMITPNVGALPSSAGQVGATGFVTIDEPVTFTSRAVPRDAGAAPAAVRASFGGTN